MKPSLLRSAVFNLVFFTTTATALVLALPILLLPPSVAQACARAWARAMLAVLRAVVGLDYELRGDPGLLRGPALIASKHQSAWDTVIFFALCRCVSYVMKKELMAIPVYGWLARHQGHIGIDRKAGASALRRLMRDARAALDAGHQIAVFPEGTRVAPGTMAPYQPGIAGLYRALGVKVVPVALNSGLYWGRRSFVKRPGTIVIEVLPPIPPGLDRAAFMRELETRIEAATRRLEAEGRPGKQGL